jgi:hypothetical protein
MKFLIFISSEFNFLKSKGYSNAFFILGLYAFEIEENRSKAIHYWSIGWNEFNNDDCAYNLGCMWFNGMWPNETQDIVTSLLSFLLLDY